MTSASPDPSAVLTYARPFVTKHDFSRLSEQKYEDLARSMSRRGWGLLSGFALAALIFLLNALMRGVQYLETAETGHLTALGMWSVAALLCLIYGSRYFSRLRRVAGFFASRKAGS